MCAHNHEQRHEQTHELLLRTSYSRVITSHAHELLMSKIRLNLTWRQV